MLLCRSWCRISKRIFSSIHWSDKYSFLICHFPKETICFIRDNWKYLSYAASAYRPHKNYTRILIYISVLFNIYIYIYIYIGARGGAVGWGTALQAGRSRVRFPTVSFEFFIYIILPAALWPWDWFSLSQNWVPRIFPGGKGGRCVGLTTLPPFGPIVLKSGSLNLLEPSGPVQACNGIAFLLPD